jgi:succinyl-CoA synthetase beta subunit
MKYYEYLGKEVLKKYGIPVPNGRVVFQGDRVAPIVEELGSVVLKAQVLSGKRGKSGGIKFTNNPSEAELLVKNMFSGGLSGLNMEAVLIEEKIKIDKELYLAITIDSTLKAPIILASFHGGMDIEEVPEDFILKYPVDVFIGIQPFIGRELARKLGLPGILTNQFVSILINLYRLFKDLDAELAEINPLVISGDKLIAADAKITIDDDALYRQKDIPYVEERTDAEQKANAIGLAYVELDGDIAVMANGAGITMATLDTLKYFGGSPANFLDAGGGAGTDKTAKALEILLSTNPKAILINVFGGITRCDDVAKAFLKVKETTGIPVPVVIRLVGTNEEQGVNLLKEVGIQAYKNMKEAVSKVVELTR